MAREQGNGGNGSTIMTEIYGLDVSKYQKEIRWEEVPPKYKFVFIRVGDGWGVRDEFFSKNWLGARATGRLRGAYHFFRGGLEVQPQLDLITSMLPENDKGELPFVADVETGGAIVTTYRARLKEYVEYMDDWYGDNSIIYTGKDQWASFVVPWYMTAPSWVAGHPLWVADPLQYRDNNNNIVDISQYRSTPRIPIGWNNYTFWQKSWVGRVPGIDGDVDVNVFNGTEAELMALVNIPAPAPLPDDALQRLWDYAMKLGWKLNE